MFQIDSPDEGDESIIEDEKKQTLLYNNHLLNDIHNCNRETKVWSRQPGVAILFLLCDLDPSIYHVTPCEAHVKNTSSFISLSVSVPIQWAMYNQHLWVP